MWIRGQNKEVLINANEIWTDSKTVYATYGTVESGYWSVGPYETEERCIEILNEIQNGICHHKATEIMSHEMEGLSSDIIQGFVYEMPEK